MASLQAVKDDKSVEQAHFILNSGDKIPALGLGTWKAGPNVVRDAVCTAIVEGGYRHIDAAHIYGNQEELFAPTIDFTATIVTLFHGTCIFFSQVGAGLAAAFAAGIDRKDVFITSKLWINSNSPEKVKPALLATLNDLGLEYLDLYLMHWPLYSTDSASQPPKEGDILPVDFVGSYQVLESLVKEKLVRNIGVSNFSIPKLEILLKEATILPAVHQVEMHPAWRNDNILEHAKANNYHVTAYSPLGSSSTNLLDEAPVVEVAKKLGKTPGQILIRWLIQRGVSTIPKSGSEHRIKENMQVFDWSIPADDVKKISSLPHQSRTNPGAELYVTNEALKEKTVAEFWGGEV